MNRSLELGKPATLDVPRIRVPQAVFLDWDRVLGNVENSLGRLYAVAERHGVDTQAVKDNYARSKRDGGSYSPIADIKAILTNREQPVPFAQVRQGFREYTPRTPAEKTFSLIYPDAPGLVARIDRARAPSMALTFGVDEDWQRGFKIEGGGYTGHTQVLPNKYKGPYLKGLVSPEGTFDFHAVRDNQIVAVIEAETAVLVDDKVVSFGGMPDNCSGYLLRRPEEEVLEAQRGDWPEELTVASLGQLVMRGGSLIRIDNPLPDTQKTMPQANTLFVPIDYTFAV